MILTLLVVAIHSISGELNEHATQLSHDWNDAKIYYVNACGVHSDCVFGSNFLSERFNQIYQFNKSDTDQFLDMARSFGTMNMRHRVPVIRWTLSRLNEAVQYRLTRRIPVYLGRLVMRLARMGT